MKLVTADEMRKIDGVAIEKYGIPSAVLMENAGRHVAQAVRELLVDEPDARVLIICGKGNNGGDGLVAARHLVNQGADVHVMLLANGADLNGDARLNFNIAHTMGVRIIENADGEAVKVQASRACIIVDAVLGTGISGEVHGVPRDAIDAINVAGCQVVSVDIPSGINADTGQVLGAAAHADVTVTFAAPKIGQVQYPGAAYCGELRVADITIPRGLTNSPSLKANLITDDMARGMLPRRHEAMHKGDAGRLVVVAGSVGMTGAAALCGTAAVRAGAGLVYLACPESLNDIIESKCTEALTVPVAETGERTISPAAKPAILGLAVHNSAVALGPGLSQNPETAQFVHDTIGTIPVPLVIDADGLNCLGTEIERIGWRTTSTVITPHPGELARLMDTDIESIEQDRVDAARRAAAAAKAVVVLKGAGTVIAEPEGEVWINLTGNAGMASGGMGDVLTGMIGAFLAAGAGPVEAAVAGVYYHGLAADEAAEAGERGLIATDLLDVLQRVLPD